MHKNSFYRYSDIKKLYPQYSTHVHTENRIHKNNRYDAYICTTHISKYITIRSLITHDGGEVLLTDGWHKAFRDYVRQSE